jgi:diguanylate cyclase (GGDEF)-like protein
VKYFEVVGRLPKSVITAAGLLGLAALIWIDYWTPPDLSFVVFYFIPIFLVAWYVGRRTGLLISFLCALAWMWADELPRGRYSHPLVPFWNIGVKGILFLVASYLISRLRSSYDKEKRSAREDVLTGLANRRSFFEDAQREFDRARRYAHPLSLAYVDVDNFKQINDQWGHHQGDTVLRFTGQAMKNNTREVDIVARLGGDEFAILIPQTSPEGARSMVEKIHRLLSEAVRDSGCPVTFSIGLVTFLALPNSVDAMITKADELMYSVKRAGKNTLEQRVF